MSMWNFSKKSLNDFLITKNIFFDWKINFTFVILDPFVNENELWKNKKKYLSFIASQIPWIFWETW